MDNEQDTALEEHERLLSVEQHLDIAEIELRNAVKAAIEADLELDVIHSITKAYYPIRDAAHMVSWRAIPNEEVAS